MVTTIFVIIITIISSLSLALELRAGRSLVELYHILRSKPLATEHPTSNGHGTGCSRPQPQGERQGETHTTGNHRGRGWDTMGWGGCESTTFQSAQQTTPK